jgi:hypothetical protein
MRNCPFFSGGICCLPYILSCSAPLFFTRHIFSLVAFKVLDSPFMCFGFRQRFESPKISPLACLWIFLA